MSGPSKAPLTTRASSAPAHLVLDVHELQRSSSAANGYLRVAPRFRPGQAGHDPEQTRLQAHAAPVEHPEVGRRADHRSPAQFGPRLQERVVQHLVSSRALLGVPVEQSPDQVL